MINIINYYMYYLSFYIYSKISSDENDDEKESDDENESKRQHNSDDENFEEESEFTEPSYIDEEEDENADVLPVSHLE